MNTHALDLAEELETMFMETPPECEEAAAELRRLHALNTKLLEALQALTHSLDYEDLLHDDQRKAFKHARAIIQEEEAK